MANKDEQEPLVYDRMPGADPLDEGEDLDLNFGLDETGNPVEGYSDEQSDTTEAEVEDEEPTSEEEEESVAEADADPEDEAEEEPVPEEPEEATAEVEEEPQKRPMVPKSRLDEVLAKQKALQKQLDEMKAQQQPAENAPEAYDFDSKEVEYQQLLLDGESQRAAALRQEMRKAERDQIAYEMRQEMSQKVQQNAQATALQQAANELEANFPVFDQNSADYNAEITQEVIELRDAFIVQGFDAVDALSKAANFAIRSYNLEATSTLNAPSAPKAKPVDEVAKKRAEVSRKLKAAESQPPELPGESSVNHGEKPLDLSTMTEEEFNALPEATLKRLRGDIQ